MSWLSRTIFVLPMFMAIAIVTLYTVQIMEGIAPHTTALPHVAALGVDTQVSNIREWTGVALFGLAGGLGVWWIVGDLRADLFQGYRRP